MDEPGQPLRQRMLSSLLAIIPVNSPASAKRRLAPVLRAELRARLVTAMLADVVAACEESRSVESILVVTPEITYLPEGMGNLAQRMCAKAGGLADVSASLVKALYDQGADVHVALPNYRRMFHLDVASVFDNEFEKVSRALPEQRIHLAQDRVFYHRSSVYGAENHLIALAFQRDQPDRIVAKQPADGRTSNPLLWRQLRKNRFDR